MVVAFDIETTGLTPYESKAILIGMKIEGKVKLWKLWESKDEAEMILSAFDQIGRIRETIVGFNNLKFDVPFLVMRLQVLGRWETGYWDIYRKKWLDLYQYLGNDFRSLSSWLNKAGIKRRSPNVDGKQVPVLYENADYKKIEDHNIDDLHTSEQLFLYLKKNNPELLPFT